MHVLIQPSAHTVFTCCVYAPQTFLFVLFAAKIHEIHQRYQSNTGYFFTKVRSRATGRANMTCADAFCDQGVAVHLCMF